ISAIDVDDGTNGHVKYSMKKTTDMASEPFHLDSEMGAITLVQSLDFEEVESFELYVQARDGGGLFDTAKVT
ncbi:PCDG7 protein, partial [Centropus unirufus]|nr:PCDG7 protein [Centropus unirufus]